MNRFALIGIGVVVVVAVAAVAVLVSGRGGDRGPTRASAPVGRFTERNPSINEVDPATPAEYRPAFVIYRRHVRRELLRMQGDVRALMAATATGDLSRARGAWLRASARYESIGAAYGAFGEMDAAINGRPGGLQGGVRSSQFTGLHRIEYALWARRSTAQATRPSARLLTDVGRLRAHLGTVRFDPLEYSLRAHEVLEDSLHLQLSGVASPWSQSALNALRSNVVGTRVVVRSLAGMVRPRDTTGALGDSTRALSRLDGELRRLAGRDGRLPRWNAVSARERERVNGLTAAAAERLSYIPEIIDPRPRRPLKTPFD